MHEYFTDARANVGNIFMSVNKCVSCTRGTNFNFLWQAILLKESSSLMLSLLLNIRNLGFES